MAPSELPFAAAKTSLTPITVKCLLFLTTVTITTTTANPILKFTRPYNNFHIPAPIPAPPDQYTVRQHQQQHWSPLLLSQELQLPYIHESHYQHFPYHVQSQQPNYNTGNGFRPSLEDSASKLNSFTAFNKPTSTSPIKPTQVPADSNKLNSVTVEKQLNTRREDAKELLSSGNGKDGAGAGSIEIDAKHKSAATGKDNVKKTAQPFAFSYDVDSEEFNTKFSRREESNGNKLHGEYRVLLPDGRLQIVSYTADNFNGFRSTVTYIPANVISPPPIATETANKGRRISDIPSGYKDLSQSEQRPQVKSTQQSPPTTPPLFGSKIPKLKPNLSNKVESSSACQGYSCLNQLRITEAEDEEEILPGGFTPKPNPTVAPPTSKPTPSAEIKSQLKYTKTKSTDPTIVYSEMAPSLTARTSQNVDQNLQTQTTANFGDKLIRKPTSKEEKSLVQLEITAKSKPLLLNVKNSFSVDAPVKPKPKPINTSEINKHTKHYEYKCPAYNEAQMNRKCKLVVKRVS